jgi:hypothetical protein
MFICRQSYEKDGERFYCIIDTDCIKHDTNLQGVYYKEKEVRELLQIHSHIIGLNENLTPDKTLTFKLNRIYQNMLYAALDVYYTYKVDKYYAISNKSEIYLYNDNEECLYKIPSLDLTTILDIRTKEDKMEVDYEFKASVVTGTVTYKLLGNGKYKVESIMQAESANGKILDATIPVSTLYAENLLQSLGINAKVDYIDSYYMLKDKKVFRRYRDFDTHITYIVAQDVAYSVDKDNKTNCVYKIA